MATASTTTTGTGTAPPSAPPSLADVVIVDWKDLQEQDSPIIAAALQAAYVAHTSTGILAIRNVPGFVDAKQALLPLAHTLAHLPSDYLEQELTDPDSLYNAGWSHGKEKLGDKPDTAKGSFYFNPIADLPGTAADRKQYPLSYPANKWPDADRIPGFQDAAVTLGCILKEATVALAQHLDAAAKRTQPTYCPDNLLYNAMVDTDKVKCRLLYYFPLEPKSVPTATEATTESAAPQQQQQQQQQDSWIGWHNDSGFLTALAGDFYVSHDTGAVLAESPDPAAGLYIVNRNHEVQRVVLPPDCMAVQMGECTQIVTGGAVTATPHCVRGIVCADITGDSAAAAASTTARISLPCFIDTPPAFPLTMPAGCTRQQVLDASVKSSKVPPLSARWTKDGMAFGDFLQQTFSKYYDWSGHDEKEEESVES